MEDKIETQLSNSQWLSGDWPGQQDQDYFRSLGGAVPNVNMLPHTFAWYGNVRQFKWAQEIERECGPKKSQDEKAKARSDQQEEAKCCVSEFKKQSLQL